MKKFLIILFTIALLGAGGYGIYHFCVKNKTDEKPTKEQTFVVNAISENTSKGTVEALPKFEFKKNEEVTLKALPTAKYNFEGWYIDTEKISADNPYTFKVTKDVNYTAKFALKEGQSLKTFAVSLVNSNDNLGTIVPLESETFNEDEVIILNATAKEGAKFQGFYDGDTLISAETPFTYHVTKDVTITAKFLEFTKEILNYEISGSEMTVRKPTDADKENLGVVVYGKLATHSHGLEESVTNNGLLRGNITFKYPKKIDGQNTVQKETLSFSFNPAEGAAHLDLGFSTAICINFRVENNALIVYVYQTHNMPDPFLVLGESVSSGAISTFAIDNIQIVNSYLYF